MKVDENKYLYRLETLSENGASIDFQEIETIEPLRSVGDIHDELDLENNKQIKRIEEITFTGDSSEYWYNDDVHTTDTHFVAYMESIDLYCHPDHHYCETDRNLFEYGDVHIDENKNFFCTSVELNGMNRIYISIDKSLLAYTVYSHETLKEYFKENPVTVWYVLRYPIEIPRIHAKGHVITHHGSTTIDVQPQTMGKVTPVVKATVEDSVIEMDSVPTMTINNTDEGNQITDLTFEGVTIVNNAKGDNVKGTKEASHTRYDFAPFYDGQTVINNTIEGGYVSAKLYGDTMINIAKPYGETDLLTATEDSAIVDLLGKNTDGVKLADGTLTEGRLYGDSYVNLIGDIYSISSAWSVDDTHFRLDLPNGQGQPMIIFKLVQTLPAGRVYTLFIEMSDYEVGALHLNLMDSSFTSSSSNNPYFGSNGWHKILFTTTAETGYFRFFNRGGVDNKYSINKHMVLIEGDHTNEDVPISAESGINSTTNPTITTTTHPFIFGKGGRI